MVKHIVTHAGNSHRDELIACSLILATIDEETQGRPPIYRRDPTEEEMEDPNVWVVDTGRDYNPAKNNYDHHQSARQSEPCCAISLVLKHLYEEDPGLYERAKDALPWLQTTEICDSKGPRQLSLFLEEDWDHTPVPMLSPVEGYVLEEFRLHNEVTDSDGLWFTMQSLGSYILYQIRQTSERLEMFEAGGQVMNIHGLQVLVAPDTMVGLPQPTLGVESWRKKVAPDAAASVFPDERGDGYSLYRFDDHPAVDFSSLQGHPEVTFAHFNGFIAKTKTRDMAVAMQLLTTAISSNYCDLSKHGQTTEES